MPNQKNTYSGFIRNAMVLAMWVAVTLWSVGLKIKNSVQLQHLLFITFVAKNVADGYLILLLIDKPRQASTQLGHKVKLAFKYTVLLKDNLYYLSIKGNSFIKFNL